MNLTLAEKLAQLMIVRIGSNMPPVRTADEDEQRVIDLLAECPLGGLVLFNGLHPTSGATLARVQAASRIPLLVGSDIERGYGQQFRPFPVFPHMMAFDHMGDAAPAAVRQFAELTALAARRAGVHIAFAPVADVNTDPRNPIISTRAFSTQPARGAELTAAAIEGFRAGGLLSCAKHFPGHGDTHQDSHHEMPTVELSAEELRGRELLPFKAAIAAGAPLLMTAHVSYPALDPTRTCATLSRPILTDLLRGELGYDGAIITDSVLMAGAMEQTTSEPDLCLRALQAGVDLLLDVGDPVAAVAELEQAVQRGDLPLERVDDAVARVLRLKQMVLINSEGNIGGAATTPEPDNETDLQDRTQAAAAEVAAAAIEVRSGAEHLPLSASQSLLAVLVNPYRSHLDPDTPELFTALQERLPHAECVELRGDESAERWDELTSRALAAEQVLAAIVVKPAAWHHFGLPAAASAWLSDLLPQRAVVLACLGTPIGLESLAGARCSLCTYSDVGASQRALVECLLG
ncbi:MAG: hypothetical protein CMJ58_03950 [Planctomycetaceae bacterium]|nr:hypothetical protein [Planctomycetaceae bacterium]